MTTRQRPASDHPHTNDTNDTLSRRHRTVATCDAAELNARANPPRAMHGRVMLQHALFGSPAVAAVDRLTKSMASAIPGVSHCVGRRGGSAHHSAGLPAERPRETRAPWPPLAVPRGRRSSAPLLEARPKSEQRCCQPLRTGTVGLRPHIYWHIYPRGQFNPHAPRSAQAGGLRMPARGSSERFLRPSHPHSHTMPGHTCTVRQSQSLFVG